LQKTIDPETGQTRTFKEKVQLQKFFALLTFFIIHDVIDKPVHRLVIHQAHIDATDITIIPNQCGIPVVT
jgi:hypothetical protein